MKLVTSGTEDRRSVFAESGVRPSTQNERRRERTTKTMTPTGQHAETISVKPFRRTWID